MTNVHQYESVFFELNVSRLLALQCQRKIELTWEQEHLLIKANKNEEISVLQVFLIEDILEKYKDIKEIYDQNI